VGWSGVGIRYGIINAVVVGGRNWMMAGEDDGCTLMCLHAE
jgi:hypothetical protein